MKLTLLLLTFSYIRSSDIPSDTLSSDENCASYQNSQIQTLSILLGFLSKIDRCEKYNRKLETSYYMFNFFDIILNGLSFAINSPFVITNAVMSQIIPLSIDIYFGKNLVKSEILRTCFYLARFSFNIDYFGLNNKFGPPEENMNIVISIMLISLSIMKILVLTKIKSTEKILESSYINLLESLDNFDKDISVQNS